MKRIVISAVTQDNLNAIRLEMISAYFKDAFRSGNYRCHRSMDNMVKSLEISGISESEANSVNRLVPKLWPGVQWDIKLSDYPGRR